MNINIYEYIGFNAKGRTSKNFIKEAHNRRLSEVLKRNNLNHLQYKVYRLGSDLYLHFKIPSESTDGILYDGILKLYKKQTLVSNNLKDYKFQYISNSPDFIYFYQYLFNQNDLLLHDFIDKLPNEGLTEEPKITNKENDISNCKGLCWILLTMENIKINSLTKLTLNSTPYNRDVVDREFKSYSEIENLIKIAKNKNKENDSINTTNTPRARKTMTTSNKMDTKSFIKKNNNTVKKNNNKVKKDFKTKTFVKKNKV